MTRMTAHPHTTTEVLQCPTPLRGWRLGVALLVTAVVYAAAARLGLSLAVVSPQVSPVWPPAGIALAACVLLGARMWPAIWVGAFAANAWVSGSVATSFPIATGNTLEALVGAALLMRAGFRPTLDTRRDILSLAVLGAGASTVISATCGALTLWLAGTVDSFWPTWTTWWLGDAMGDLAFAPLVLTWACRVTSAAPARIAEAAAMYLVAFVMGSVIFVVLPRPEVEMKYLMLLPLVWSALRLGQADTAVAVAAVSVLASWGSAMHAGERAGSLNTTLLLIQAFVGVVAASALLLGAVAAERRRAEDDLRESEAHLRLALEAAHMGTWEWQARAGRIRWSAGMAELHGLPPEAGEGPLRALLDGVAGDDRPRAGALLRGAAGAGGAATEYRTAAGAGERWLEGRGRMIQGPDGHAEKVVGVCIDITPRKCAERELARRAEELARSNSDLEDFAYIASHDLKEPLRGIGGYVSMLLEDHIAELSPAARERVGAIGRLTIRMEELISALLEYSRLGRTELAVSEVDLGEVAREAMASLSRLESDGVEVAVGALPTVRCDRVRVRQVFANLIGNGAKYNDKPKKRIEVGACAREGGQVLFVRDNGIGIQERHLPKLFRMFRRLNPRSRFGDSTGAGLAIVKGIIERHGGRIWCESKPGEGSTFYFTLGAGAAGDGAPEGAGAGGP